MAVPGQGRPAALHAPARPRSVLAVNPSNGSGHLPHHRFCPAGTTAFRRSTQPLSCGRWRDDGANDRRMSGTASPGTEDRGYGSTGSVHAASVPRLPLRQTEPALRRMEHVGIPPVCYLVVRRVNHGTAFNAPALPACDGRDTAPGSSPAARISIHFLRVRRRNWAASFIAHFLQPPLRTSAVQQA
jgi:hypothetical protein